MYVFIMGVGMLTSPASAHPSGHETDDYYRPSPRASATLPPPIPDTYAGVVEALRTRLSSAEIALAGLKISDLRREGSLIRDLAIAVPGKAATLSASTQVSVATSSSQIQVKVAELVRAAEKGDMAGAKAAVAAVRAEIEVLQTLGV